MYKNTERLIICRFRVEGGELFDKVVSIDKYPESTAKLLFYQMACAYKVGSSCMLVLTGV